MQGENSVNNKTNWILLGVTLVAVVAIFYLSNRSGGKAHVQVTVPELTAGAAAGMALFNRNCATCHGVNAAGTGAGPPLIHKIYEPNHHGDMAFQRAAKFGVRSHHWQFGNMPPVPGVTKPDVAKIIRYVRELQRANGIL